MNFRILSVQTPEDAAREMGKVGAERVGIEHMAKKAALLVVKIEKISSPQANILKQEMFSLGGEVAVARDVVTGRLKSSDCLVVGTLTQMENLSSKLEYQPFGLKKIGGALREVLSKYGKQDFNLQCGRHLLKLGQRTHIMGILNVTPDSFSDGGLFLDEDSAVEQARRMCHDGADIIDVGGESTRPGARPVTVQEEIDRVIPVIKRLAKEIDGPISIDTSKSEVARRALDLGASMVNDIRGLRADPELPGLVAKFDVPVVIMHIKGRPRTMQKRPQYKSLISEIISSLRKSIQIAHEAGIRDEKIIIDPGIGFGKTTAHNLEILKNLDEFRTLGYPILVGTSRKSLIGNVLDLPIDQRLMGTAATVSLVISKGAKIVRVHDVKEMARVVRMADSILRCTSQGLEA